MKQYIQRLTDDMRLELCQWLDTKVVNRLSNEEVLKCHTHKMGNKPGLLKEEHMIDTAAYIAIVEDAIVRSNIQLR